MATAAQNLTTPGHLPERIGRFKPVKKLGRGAQGIVYLARDTELDREVAIKTLTRKQQANANLINEARNVSKLDHKNIVSLYEIGVHEGATFLVYRYIDGESLKQRLKTGQAIPKVKAVKLLAQILEGIDYAHERGILHRDLNPANILIDREEIPKVLDFGISQDISAETTSDVSGTVNYLAPELLSNETVGPPADLFSIGLVLYEMLTGRMVFKGENPMAVMYQIVNENVLPPSKFNKDIDPTLDQITMRALERAPDKRYQTAAAMLGALNEYLQGFESSDETEEKSDAKNSTLEFLMRRMQRKQDFPAISSHITEINQKASQSSISSATELSNVILKDYALTTKLLRLVNSSFYGQFGGEITTVSRAIIILGYEQVRSAALSIILFEHLSNEKQANEIKKTAYSALMGGIIAREQAKKMRLNVEEEVESAFIASMFHTLGKLLSIYYFPEEYQEITHLINGQGLDENQAARSVLGLPFHEIGKGIAKEWKLPGVIVDSMNKMPDGQVKPAKNRDETIRQLSSFANELCRIGQMEPEAAADAKKELAGRYEEALKVDKNQIEELITTSQHEIKEFTRALNIDTKGVKLFATESPLEDTAGNSVNDSGSNSDMDEGDDLLSSTSNSALEKAIEAGDEESQNKARQEILMNGVAEITNAMLDDFDLNELLTMVLETIYRGMGFTRVLFCIRDARNSTINAKFGLGKMVDEVIPKFRFKIESSNDIIHEAISKGKEFIILDVNSKEYKGRVPDYLRKVTNPRSVVLYPIVVNRKVIGLLYADMDECAPDVSVDALKFFKTLRNQASLAIQQKNSK